jgi:AP-1 complex subunit sigma 1/2
VFFFWTEKRSRESVSGWRRKKKNSLLSPLPSPPKKTPFSPQLVRELTTTVLARSPKACNILEIADFRAVYRRYASLFFVVGIDGPTTSGNGGGSAAAATAAAAVAGGGENGAGTTTATATTTTTPGDNELAALATAHLYVEVLDSIFGNVCELDLVFNFHVAHHALDELVVGGIPVEPGRGAAARAVAAADAAVEAEKAGSLGLVEAALGAGEV